MRKRIKVGTGIWIFAAFVLLGGYRFTSISTVIPWAMAAILHELGHLTAIRLLGLKVKNITLDILGARIAIDGAVISYRAEATVAFAGPLVNMSSVLFFYECFPNFSVFSLVLGVLNLFPVFSLDGYRIIYSVIAMLSNEKNAEKLTKYISFVFLFFMWSFSAYMLLNLGSGFSLFLISCSLLFSNVQKRG